MQNTRSTSKQQFSNLSLGQKVMAFLSLIILAVVGFFTASVMLSIVAIVFCIMAVALVIRWIWCKITGKPFIPSVRVNVGTPGAGQFYRNGGANRQQSSANGDTIDAEFHEVEQRNEGLDDSSR
jgi:hypothetical protein